MPARIPSETLLEDLHRVKDKLNRIPKQADYRKHGNHSPETLISRFGNEDARWVGVLAAAGLCDDIPDHQPSTTPTPVLRSDFRRVAEKLGHTPTRTEYREHGDFGAPTLANRLGNGTWGSVCATIRITDHNGESARDSTNRNTDPQTTSAEHHQRSRRERIQADIQRVAEKIGTVPEYEDYQQHGEYHFPHLRREFGGWEDAIEAIFPEVTVRTQDAGEEPRSSPEDATRNENNS